MIKILSSSESSAHIYKKRLRNQTKNWHWYITGYKKQEIRKYDWSGCHWLNQNRDEHQNGITVIPTSVVAFFILYYSECIHISSARPTFHIFLYVGLAAGCCETQYSFVLRHAYKQIQMLGIAVIPFWCSSQFWFHFFCSQWQATSIIFFYFIASDVSVLFLHHNTFFKSFLSDIIIFIVMVW